MARLPEPGKDVGTWGIILNDFLNQSHNADGSIKDNAINVDLSGKVDKVTGKSLILNTDITRLEGTSGANTGDQDLSGIDAQLADNVQKQRKLINSEKTAKKTYVTLMDDDGKAEFMTTIKPILDEYGYKMSVCINAGFIGTAGYMTWANIATLVAEGHEILNHGYIHSAPSALTLEQLQANYVLEKAAFVAHNLDTYDYYVYGGVMPWTDVNIRNKVSSVYKSCFGNTDAPFNYIPFDNFNVRRTSICLDSSLSDVSSEIDTGGYCVMFGHGWMYTAGDLAKLRTTLTYLQTNIASITFVTGKQMIDDFSNIINLGDLGYDRFMLDKNGNVDFNVGGKRINELTQLSYDSTGFTGKAITLYRKDSVTIELVGSNYATHWLPESGTVKTFRTGIDDRYSYQEYTKVGSIELWKRTWDNTKMRWNKFSPLSGVALSTTNRPKYIRRGCTIFDYTILKNITAQADTFGVAYTQVDRNLTYGLSTPTAGVYINTSTETGITNARLYECVVAGTTDPSTAPTYGTVLDGITIDGTAQFKYIGDKVVYRDGAGTIVT